MVRVNPIVELADRARVRLSICLPVLACRRDSADHNRPIRTGQYEFARSVSAVFFPTLESHDE
jgi:hypothetical protein